MSCCSRSNEVLSVFLYLFQFFYFSYLFQVLSVTCGRGKSCIGECSALEATLCPSGNCTGDPEDCNPSRILEEEEEEVNNYREKRAVANQASWQFNWCSPRCNVRRHSACCFHSGCRSKRKQRCNWLSYLTGDCTEQNLIPSTLSGNSCPKPGSIPNGSWSCLMQELPVPDATFLDPEEATYPGE